MILDAIPQNMDNIYEQNKHGAVIMNIENCRIAIADDEAMIRYALKTIIKTLGMNCIWEATNGQEAVDMYAKEQPDMMLMDINMPVKNGDEALKEIHAKYPKANIVMLTSVAEIATVTKCVQDGAINYILKTNPLDKIKILIAETVKNI
jgi:two-component system, chemotaxis family, chemotaxis protein CheY